MHSVSIPNVPATSFRRILYATDFSDASLTALPIAANLARRYGSDLYLAHIWSLPPQTMETPATVVVISDYSESAAKADMEKVLNADVLEGLHPSVLIQEGSPTEEILAIIDKQHIDLVVMGTHGRKGIKHFFLGSAAEEISRSAPCPVLTVGPHISKKFSGTAELNSIIFPTDMTEASAVILPYLASIASEFNSRITILHVLPASAASNPDARRLAETLVIQMRHTFAPQLDPQSREYLIEFGDTAETILRIASDKGADLIGMGIRNAFSVATQIQMTAAYKIMTNAQCPVLTYRANVGQADSRRGQG